MSRDQKLKMKETGRQLTNNLRFLAKWSRDIASDLLTQVYTLKCYVR